MLVHYCYFIKKNLLQFFSDLPTFHAICTVFFVQIKETLIFHCTFQSQKELLLNAKATLQNIVGKSTASHQLACYLQLILNLPYELSLNHVQLFRFRSLFSFLMQFLSLFSEEWILLRDPVYFCMH